MKKIPLLIFTISLFMYAGAQENKKLLNLVKKVEEIDKKYELNNDSDEEFRFREVSDRLKRTEEYRNVVVELESFPVEKLSIPDNISRRILLLKLKNEVSQVDYKQYLLPFNAEGGFYNQPAFLLRNRSFMDEDDYQSYLKWLISYTHYINYNMELLHQGMEEGVVRPKIIVENTLDLLKPWLSTDFSVNPFGGPFTHFPDEFSSVLKNEFSSQAHEVLSGEVIPVYRALEKFLREEYLSKCPEKPGISTIPGGREYYENRIKFFTTLDITPDSVFNLGHEEVLRIRTRMLEIIEEVDFKGNFNEFVEFLRTDDQFYAKTPEELLNKAAWLSKKAEGGLPLLFSKLYELPFTVEPVPAAIATNYTAGRYVSGNRSSDKPGIYWVNTYDLKSRPLYALPALTLHEAVPGHHLGMMRAAEITGLPDFRKGYYISAYGEGWGLYSEFLGEEMGMYNTPYEWFGRYTYEMWRACRLVVDVGIHYKGWSRQQALDFLEENTALSLHEVKTEIDRYIGWPGQAVSYKIGEITIKALREKVVEKLGDDFNIQEFHELMLKNGSVPLPVLNEEVERYLVEKID